MLLGGASAGSTDLTTASVALLLGHSKAVRDICFNTAGTQFLSAAYDRYLKLWDTETGKCAQLTLLSEQSVDSDDWPSGEMVPSPAAASCY